MPVCRPIVRAASGHSVERVSTRRQVVLALGAGVLAPPASLAQPRAEVWRIGFLSVRPVSPNAVSAVSAGMRELGYVEGKTAVVEWRFAGGDYGRLPIERPTKIDLVLIMKTAKAPGLSIPQELLLSANEVIE